MHIDEWPDIHIAHRGLHNPEDGIVENSSSAFQAAITAGFAIELDVQCLADHTPVVFHDFTMERLTNGKGAINQLSAAELKNLPLKQSGEHILTLNQLLEEIAGQVPLLIEIKSDWQTSKRHSLAEMETKIATALATYKGQYGVMSFNPAPIHTLHTIAPNIPLGLTTCDFSAANWPELTNQQLHQLRRLKEAQHPYLSFIAHDINTLECYAPQIRALPNVSKLLTWTVRTKAQSALAASHGDHMIFEGHEVLAYLNGDKKFGV